MSKFMIHFSVMLIIGGITSQCVAQKEVGKHPGYLHALSDLRAARFLLSNQPGDQRVYSDEQAAVQEVDAAINEIKRASFDDGKDINDHPPLDVKDHGARLLRAIEILKKAHHDIEEEEDNPEVKELRYQAGQEIDRAAEGAERAHARAVQDMRK